MHDGYRPAHLIPQMEPHFDDVERQFVDAYLRAPGHLTEFVRTKEFEDGIAALTGAKHCIVMMNGTVTLVAIAIALGVKPGDEVIVPDYSMIATANAFSVLGAKIKFAPVERETLCLDLHAVAGLITARTKAIVLMGANGRHPSYPIRNLQTLADSQRIPLIEDAAQGLGCTYQDGTHLGLKGLAGSLSFSSQKIISTGQGGAIITNDDEMASHLRRVKDFGRARGGEDFHPQFGLNFKFTELQACVGLAQMSKLPARLKRRKEIAALYEQLLRPVEQVRLFRHNLETTAPWFTDCVVEERESLIAFLADHLIGSRPMYSPMSGQPIYNEPLAHPVSELIGRQGLWLPSHTHLADDQVQYIGETIVRFYSRKSAAGN